MSLNLAFKFNSGSIFRSFGKRKRISTKIPINRFFNQIQKMEREELPSQAENQNDMLIEVENVAEKNETIENTETPNTGPVYWQKPKDIIDYSFLDQIEQEWFGQNKNIPVWRTQIALDKTQSTIQDWWKVYLLLALRHPDGLLVEGSQPNQLMMYNCSPNAIKNSPLPEVRSILYSMRVGDEVWIRLKANEHRMPFNTDLFYKITIKKCVEKEHVDSKKRQEIQKANTKIKTKEETMEIVLKLKNEGDKLFLNKNYFESQKIYWKAWNEFVNIKKTLKAQFTPEEMNEFQCNGINLANNRARALANLFRPNDSLEQLTLIEKRIRKNYKSTKITLTNFYNMGIVEDAKCKLNECEAWLNEIKTHPTFHSQDKLLFKKES